MPISKLQPMRPALDACIDAINDGFDPYIEEVTQATEAATEAAEAANLARENIQTDLAAKADKTGTYSTLTAGGTTPDSVTNAMLVQTGGVLEEISNYIADTAVMVNIDFEQNTNYNVVYTSVSLSAGKYVLLCPQYANNSNTSARAILATTNTISTGVIVKTLYMAETLEWVRTFTLTAEEAASITYFTFYTKDAADLTLILANVNDEGLLTKVIELGDTVGSLDGRIDTLDALHETSIDATKLDFIEIASSNLYTGKYEDNSHIDVDGTIGYNANFSASDFIAIDSIKVYDCCMMSSGALTKCTNMTIGWYDSFKRFIRRETGVNVSAGTKNFENLTIPVNAAYIRLSGYKNQMKIAMFGEYAAIHALTEYEKFAVSVPTKADAGLPSYYYANNWLGSRIEAIRDATNITDGVTFAFVTDMHFSANSLNSKYLLKEILDNTTVQFVVCGGDFAAVYGSSNDLENAAQTVVEYQNYIGKEKFFAIRGNHDFYNRDDENSSNRYLPEPEIYNVIGRNCERYTIDMQPSHLCYTIEIQAQNTCFLMMNSKDASGTVQSYVTGEQAAWICSKLIEKKDWKIVAVSHIPADPAIDGYDSQQDIIHTMLSAFNSRTSINTEHKGTAIIGNFADATGNVVCHITGHNHKDASNLANNVLSITTGCDARYLNDDNIPARTIGTTLEQLIDVFCIDYDNETIKAVRVGAGSSRNWVL